MHQTFYIDADEEISSVIDKLNKSVSTENYFVVPKRALFLQSIVNLKLLKREAEKLSKHLVIVTQDEIGASMAERSGLEVKHTIEGLESKEIEEVFHANDAGQELDFYDSEVMLDQFNDKKNRLDAVGSTEFFDSAEISDKKRAGISNDGVKSQTRKIPVNGISAKEKVRNLSDEKNVQKHASQISQKKIGNNGHTTSSVSEFPYKNKIDSSREKSLEKMFSTSRSSRESARELPIIGNGTSKKIFIGFIVSCIVVFCGVAAYLFFPSANVGIVPKISTEKVDIVILGDAGISQVDQSNIPIRIVDKEESISLSYNVVGSGAGVGKKAHGTVVIYNEYSNSPQTLVATTRLESSTGKIFRLVKNVIVPGATVVGAETKSGAIEAEVVADQPGEDFNIAPSSFSVPGFKDSPKFEKFYAKSVENFVGGSSEGGNSAGVVNQKDIDNAKQKTENTIKEKLINEITSELGEGEILLEQAEKISIIKTGTTARVGNMVNTIDYGVTSSIRAFIFSEKDVKSVVGQSIKNRENLKNADWEISKLEYGISVADFEKNTLELKIHSEILITPFIDTEKIKKELLGKKDDELGFILKNYSSIKMVNVELQPTIISRIPQYSWRVNVIVEKSNE